MAPAPSDASFGGWRQRQRSERKIASQQPLVLAGRLQAYLFSRSFTVRAQTADKGSIRKHQWSLGVSSIDEVNSGQLVAPPVLGPQHIV